MEKRKYLLYVGVACFVLSCILFVATHLYKTSFYQTELDAEYIGQEALTPHETVNKVLFQIDINDDLKVCVCLMGNGEIETMYIEWRGTYYSALNSHEYSFNELREKSKSYIKFKPLVSEYTDIDVCYGLFLNPQENQITINGESVKIHKRSVEWEGETYTLGFWSIDLPAGETPIFN